MINDPKIKKFWVVSNERQREEIVYEAHVGRRDEKYSFVTIEQKIRFMRFIYTNNSDRMISFQYY